MAIHQSCDGIARRDFLRCGALGFGALGGPGLSLASYLRLNAAGQVHEATAKQGIFIHLQGGPSHLDTFDMKPDAPTEYRGTFNPIETAVPGMQITEHLPKIAQCADKLVLLRGVTHTLGAHRLGSEYVNTGTRPLPSLEYPGFGSVVAKETAPWNAGDLPAFVSIPQNGHQKPGFLGIQYAALSTGGAPKAGTPFRVRGVNLAGGLTIQEVEKRQNLRNDLDIAFQSIQQEDPLLAGLDRFSQQAHAIITSRRSRDAFDISQESPHFTKPFGESAFGLSCLLATRLVASGVRFVSMQMGGWDTHQNNFSRLKDDKLPTLDEGLAALLIGLEQKGLLESTAVYVTGEFGRTPKINSKSSEGGRDHYPRCMFMLLAGGGMRGGQVIGQSDDKATLPAHEDQGLSPDDVAATFYHALGIDHAKEYHTTTGRPVMIVREGKVIPAVFA